MTVFFDVVQSGYRKDYKLKSEFTTVVRQAIAEEAKKYVQEEVNSVVDYDKIRVDIYDKVKLASDWVISELAKDNLEYKLNQLTDKKIKEKLGL